MKNIRSERKQSWYNVEDGVKTKWSVLRTVIRPRKNIQPIIKSIHTFNRTDTHHDVSIVKLGHHEIHKVQEENQTNKERRFTS